MNMLNNWLPGERMDVWVARHGGHAPAMYAGFDQADAPASTEEVDGPSAVSAPGSERLCRFRSPRKDPTLPFRSPWCSRAASAHPHAHAAQEVCGINSC